MKKLQTFIDLNEKRGVKEKCKDDFTIGKDGFLFAELEEKWKIEYNARTSAEPSNKPEKLDFKLEDGRHLSTKMWYCHLYQGIATIMFISCTFIYFLMNSKHFSMFSANLVGHNQSEFREIIFL